MEIDDLRHYCLNKKGVEETLPFDNETLVYKVMGKIFALTSLARWDKNEPTVVLKCDPQQAINLRERYDDSVVGAWHMNKKHWNSIALNQSMDDRAVTSWIDHSYNLVVAGLTKKLQAQLKSL